MMKPEIHEIHRCVACGGKVVRDFDDIEFEFEDGVVVVKDVPVLSCTNCGEQYIPGPVGVVLSELAQVAADYAEIILTEESDRVTRKSNKETINVTFPGIAFSSSV